MAFERLQSLGKDRFDQIMNDLMTGKTTVYVARKIQQEWGLIQDVAEKSLIQQVNRLKHKAAEGMFGKTIADKLMKLEAGKGVTDIEKLKVVNVSTLDRLEELASWHRNRAMDLKTKEKNMPIPVGSMLTATSVVFKEYRDTLTTLQELRFTMGLDAKVTAPPPPPQMARVTNTKLQLPDGTNVDQQVFEAYQAAEEILNSEFTGKTFDGQVIAKS